MLRYDINLNDFRTDETGVTLERVKKSHHVFSTLFLDHYPGSRGIMGRSLTYLARLNGEVAGIIGANSPPMNYKLFREFFNTENERLFLNNNVFRLTLHEKNLGTQVLKAFRERVRIDYRERFNEELLGLMTFVEPPRDGALYKADNWTFLGHTQGKTVQKRDFGALVNKEWGTGTKKLIYAIRFKAQRLQG
jgi:hypothetical protein